METIKIKNVTFIHGDCMEFLKEQEENAFDLAIVDPPYGLKRFSKVKEHTAENSKDVYAKRGSFKAKGKNWNNTKPTKFFFDKLFFSSINQIIWGANNFKLPVSEYFCVWDKYQAFPNFATAELAFVSMGLKKPAKVFRYDIKKENGERKRKGGKIHPAQKPIALYKWLLLNYAKEGDKILDTHGGSGSIAIACHQLGFELTIIEKDKEYFDNMIKRFKLETAQLSIF